LGTGRTEVNLTELEAQARRYHRRVSAADSEREKLYALIRKARRDGYSLRTIAAAAGLTFGRIEQITKGK